MASRQNSYNWALKIKANVDPSVARSAQKASGLISSIVKADLIASGIKKVASGFKSFISSSVTTYADFEQSLANAGAIAGASSEEFKKMHDIALKMGRTTSFTASQSADALKYMSLAGWKVKEQMSALPEILKMAQATGADLAFTSDQITDTMGGWGLTTDNLTEYLDVLVQTNNKANTSASQLMEAFVGCSADAQKAGMTYKETSVALGILANNGIKGSQAGTALSSMLSRMTSNKKALDTYKQLGVNIFDASGKMRDFGTILKETDAKLSTLNDEKRASALTSIAGVNYSAQYQILLKSVKTAKDGSKEWDKLSDCVNNAKGALNALDAKTTDTVKFAFVGLGSAIDGAKIAFIERFAPEIKAVVNYLSSSIIPKISKALEYITTPIANVINFTKLMANAFRENSSKGAKSLEFISKYGMMTYKACMLVCDTAKQIGGAFSWITDISNRMRDLSNLFTKYKDALTYAGIALGTLTAVMIAYKAQAIAVAIASWSETVAISAYVVATNIATIATTAFGVAVAILTSPITAIIVAIGALIAGLVYLYKNNETVRNGINKLWSSFKTMASVVGGAVVKAFNIYWGVVCKVREALKPLTDFIFNQVVKSFKFLYQIITAVVSNGLNHFANIVKGIIQALTGLCDFITGVFSGNWSLAWQGIVSSFGAIFSTIGNIALTPLNAIITLINQAINGINQIKIPDWVPSVGGMSANIPQIPQLALAHGGIATKATNAIIGEGAESEAVLPLSKLDALLNRESGANNRKKWHTALENITNNKSSNTANNITFAPTINIDGNANKSDVKKAMSTAFSEFKKMMSDYEKQQKRKSFSL